VKPADETAEKAWLANFRASIARDLYTPADIISASRIETSLQAFEPGVSRLEASLTTLPLTQPILSGLLTDNPALYSALARILAIPAGIDLQDGRRLPDPRTGLSADQVDDVAAVLIDLGIDTLLCGPGQARAMLRAALIREDADRRRKRVDDKLSKAFAKIVLESVEGANLEPDLRFTLSSPSTLPPALRRSVNELIAVNGSPRIAIAYTFQAYSGGRQQRDISTVYPNASNLLEKAGIDLVLIADGQGVRTISERILRDVYRHIPVVLTLAQAQSGGLTQALIDLKAPPPPKTIGSEALERIISDALGSAGEIQAAELPVPTAEARLALAAYAARRPDQALALGTSSDSLAWRRLDDVRRARRLQTVYDPAAALELLGKLIDQGLHWDSRTPVEAMARIQLPYQFQSGQTLAYATHSSASVPLLREAAKRSLQRVQQARMCLLLVPGTLARELQDELLRTQTYLAASVVVIDAKLLTDMAQGLSPTEALKRAILEQTDLTKISPFVLRGATPARVFRGRQQEEADLVGTIRSNSVALLGGRRIGKTSLMKHVISQLNETDIQPYFADCQVVQTWSDFGALARREWRVDLPDAFLPENLNDLVEQLSDSGRQHVVIFLDEIDHLLDWDANHDQDKVKEAFFRQCRAISQTAKAQFVFSGERRIAQKFWDASSPHWNFCRPIMLRQLTRIAAGSLLSEPIEGLGVALQGKQELLDLSWQVTNGHPELIQYLGDQLVGIVNDRSRDRIQITAEDVREVANTTSYINQYLTTYWGQSSEFEKLVSLLIVGGFSTSSDIAAALHAGGVKASDEDLRRAVKMIELYGIIDDGPAAEIGLRADWFVTALQSYGTVEDQIARAMEGLA